jgi:hypothetical protein
MLRKFFIKTTRACRSERVVGLKKDEGFEGRSRKHIE